MIVVCGPGRSGTSFVARLYKELGFDPGGEWDPAWRAGLEDPEITHVNRAIVAALGVSTLGPGQEVPQRARNVGKLFMTNSMRERARALERRVMARRQPQMLDWSSFEEVVRAFAPDLQLLEQRHTVVKDPLFCWTLGVWAASGTRIDHVLVCMRTMQSAIESHKATGYLDFSDAGAKNSFIYGLGVCVAAVTDHRIPHAFVRFPDFLDAPAELFAAMTFPAAVSYDDFLEAFTRTAQKDIVHDWR